MGFQGKSTASKYGSVAVTIHWLSALLIVALLGITCSVSYVLSRSLWTPIIIHWLTVVVWVIFLGGRNKLLEL